MNNSKSDQSRVEYGVSLGSSLVLLLIYRGIDLRGKIKIEVKELPWVSFKIKMKQKAIQNYNVSP